MSKRAGIYVRVSTQDQSTELQRRELENYVAARGWGSPVVYDDSGKSGTTGNRPMLKALLRDAKERKIDVVVTWKLDRLFRSLKDLISTLQDFTEVGIDFISLRDNIDLTTSSGRLMMHMLGAFGEFEAALIKERVKAGLANAKANGKVLGRPKSSKHADIALLRASGLSIRKIALQLGVSKSLVQDSLSVRKTPFG